MVVGSAIHRAIELRLKDGSDPYKTCEDYIAENLTDKFPLNRINFDILKEKQELASKCLENFEKEFYGPLTAQITDPDKELEVKMRTEIMGVVFTGIVDVMLQNGVWADWKTGRIPEEDWIKIDPQAPTYIWLAKACDVPAPTVFNYVYLQGKNEAKRMATYRTGPRAGQKYIRTDTDNPRYRFSYPVYYNNDQVDIVLNDYLKPAIESFKNQIFYKVKGQFTCNGCQYKTICDQTPLPEQEYPRILPLQ